MLPLFNFLLNHVVVPMIFINRERDRENLLVNGRLSALPPHVSDVMDVNGEGQPDIRVNFD